MYSFDGDNVYNIGSNVGPILPPHIYTVNHDSQKKLTWSVATSRGYILPEKFYGQVGTVTKRIENAVNNRQGKNTGVILSGAPGSGKSLTFQKLANAYVAAGHPVFMINEPIHGVDLIAYFNKINQPALIIFDEFDKVYNNQERQQSLLGLFDGVLSTRNKLFIITMNTRVNKYLYNRPGRFLYHIEFNSALPDVIIEFAKDNQLSDGIINDILRAHRIYSFNFDSVISIVNELKYNPGTTVIDVLNFLNIEPMSSNRRSLWIIDNPEVFPFELKDKNKNYYLMASDHVYLDVFLKSEHETYGESIYLDDPVFVSDHEMIFQHESATGKIKLKCVDIMEDTRSAAISRLKDLLDAKNLEKPQE